MACKLKQFIEDWQRRRWYKKAIFDVEITGKSPQIYVKKPKIPERGLLAKSDFDAYSLKGNKPQIEL
ncbi:MAG TPA: hypothetical protein VJB39_01370 [Patescibacteria group bacterium]|nr:hypothetical protein [Patescibacteria group bacterium]